MDLEDFKSFSRVLKPSGVGSIPTRSRQSFPGEGFTAMSERRVRLSVGMALIILLCVGMLVSASPATAAMSDGLIPLTWSWGDSTRAVTAKSPPVDTALMDSVRAFERAPVWPMGELKRVLGEETGRAKPGANYTERKSGRLAMACALLVPGLGQMYNEKPVKAAVAVGLESFYLGHVFMNRRYWDRQKKVRDTFPVNSSDWAFHDRWVKEYWERSIDWIWWSSAVVFAVVIDAYVDAHLDDMRFRVEARPEERGFAVSYVIPY